MSDLNDDTERNLGDPGTHRQRVDVCLRALSELAVHPDVGAENAHTILRDGGWHFTSAVVTEAMDIRTRACGPLQRPRALPAQPPVEHEPQLIPQPETSTADNEFEPSLIDEQSRAGIDTERLDECLRAIAKLDMPLETGAPKIRDALRAAGHTFANEVIAAAVKTRKTTP